MVIQRLQNLLLLISLMLMVVFIATPYAHIDAAPIYAAGNTVFLILNIVIIALTIIDICMFKNLKKQMSIAGANILLQIAAIVCGLIICYTGTPVYSPVWFGGIVLIVLSTICTISARSYMAKDQKLLRSYDRLR